MCMHLIRKVARKLKKNRNELIFDTIIKKVTSLLDNKNGKKV